jgi:2-polyprenyl-6-methoxyphenol hydroxylase-like FAD-dependent oxidoreductase
MTSTYRFRVIIAGGGISGLTLANALEKANIDYVLLEARDTIAPQVGASIGIFQNGGRILDQLGCFEEIREESVPAIGSRLRDKHGKQFFHRDGSLLIQARLICDFFFLAAHN